MAGSSSGGKGGKKIGRSKRKAEGHNRPIGLFVRGKISAKQYWEMTGQSSKKAVIIE